MENNKIIKSFQTQKTLNPKIWKKISGDFYILKSEIREKLLEIAYEFIESLKVDFIVSDVHLTGSLVNYNWSEYSDFDLHIIADFKQFSKTKLPLYQELFKLKKTLFNSEQNIKIYGYDVEVFVQDKNERGHSAGVYSLISDEWLHKPKKDNMEIDKDTLKTKITQWTEKIDEILKDAEQEDDLEKSKNLIDNLKNKLKDYRKLGLEKGGEMSYENLVFKYLRRSGHIEKLFNFKTKKVDKKLSINESVTKLGGIFSVDLENGPNNHKTRALGNWQSDNAWDVFAPPGTKVNSYTNGVVSKIRNTGKNSGKVFGTQVSVSGGRGFPDIFYTHLKNVNVNVGDKINVGDFIGEVSEWIGHNGGEHVHIGLPYGNHLKSLLVNSDVIFSNRGATKTVEKTKSENKNFKVPTGKFLNPLGNQKYSVTSRFGVRRIGYNHAGADMALPSGSKLFSPGDGVVIDAKIRTDACGGTLFIDHKNGFKSRFCHLKQINVSKGDIVKGGQLLGYTGGGLRDVGHGSTTGPHLHFEFYKNGSLVNGLDYVYTPNVEPTIDNSGSSSSPSAENISGKKEQPISFFEKILVAIFGDLFFKKDDPKKSDYVKSDIVDLYKTLNSISGDLSKSDNTNLNFQKNVESIQIGLALLGYEFSNFGVDGLYGSETSKNVEDFKRDYSLEEPDKINGDFITETQIKKLVELLKNKNITNEDIKKYIDKPDFSKMNLSKGDIATSKEIIDFFVNKGLSVEQSAGIAGNLFAESSFKTNIWGDNNTSYGLAQWHAERMRKLFKWAESKGYDVNSIEGQLEYLWYELENNESNALNFLRKTTTPADAASTFAAKFERPASSNYSKRVQNAENFYRSYKKDLS